MRAVIVCVLAALLMMTAPARGEAPRRVALVIGNQTYRSLTALGNPRLDASRLAALLDANGFEVVRCDGQHPGCFDLDRDGLEDALEAFRKKADGADLALAFYAGHGMEGRDGNVLAPVDMEISDCAERTLRKAVALDALFKAMAGAHSKIVILDACRNDPMAQCPMRGSRPMSFAPLTVPESESYLLVSSTKPGQLALDGPTGADSPYARALLQWLEKAPEVYFQDVLSYVAKDVIEETARANLTQVPEMLQRGMAPADCLKGVGCVGDVRAAVLSQEMADLRQEHTRDQELAAIARDYLAAAEKDRRPLSEEEKRQELQKLKQVSDFMLEAERGRGHPFSNEERTQELQRLVEAGRALIALKDTRGERALERLNAGDESEAKRLFAEAAAAHEQAAQTASSRAAEENREAAKSLRHLADIARPKNVAEAADIYKEATRLDPDDAQTWIDYGRVAMAAGRYGEAKAAFEQADLKARESNDPLVRYRAAQGLGDATLGDTEVTERQYRAALALAQEGAKANAGDPAWQRALSVAHCRIGGLFFRQRNLPAAVESYQACRATAETLASADPDNSELQQDLAWAQVNIADVQREQGDLVGALASYQAALNVAERYRDDSSWWGQIGMFHGSISGVQDAQGNLAGALASVQTALDFVERRTKSDPSDARWQLSLAVMHLRKGRLLEKSGDRPGALVSYQAQRAICERLLSIDPANPFYQNSLALSYRAIGLVQSRQGDHAGALASYQEAVAIDQRLVASDPANISFQGGLGFDQRLMGGALAARGDLPGALASYRAAVASYGKTDPGDGLSQWNLAVTHMLLGQVLQNQGDLAGALTSYRTMQNVGEHIVRLEPGNASYQGNLALAQNLIGDMMTKQGNLADALVSYQAALSSYGKLDPDNAATREALRSARYSIGYVLQMQGDLAGALASFQAGLAINQRLASAEPGNTDRQRAVWSSHILIGDVLYDQGHLAEALASYAVAQDIAENRSKAEPDDSGWKRNLAASYRSVAGVRLANGDRTGALALWHKALAVVEASAVAVEQDEIKSAGKPGAKTADALRQVGWNALIARDVTKAAAAWARWSTLAPDRWPEVGRAHVLLFRNRLPEARALYLKYKGKGTLVDGRPWEQVIANDFQALRRAGLARPMMREVEVALGVAPAQVNQSGAATAHRAGKSMGSTAVPKRLIGVTR
jgi:tetratricopeptide (TPR) repeat protein